LVRDWPENSDRAGRVSKFNKKFEGMVGAAKK